MLSQYDHNMLKFTSKLSLLSIGLGIYYKLFDMTLMSCMILLTSIKYWNHPSSHYTLWKKIDIINVCFWLVYCFFKSFHCIYQCTYFFYLAYAIVSFLLCQYTGIWLVHCNVHIFANIANFYLFSGL